MWLIPGIGWLQLPRMFFSPQSQGLHDTVAGTLHYFRDR